ncbi:hypothetical protein SEVIR_7G310100v4 [Setaria viridis]
MDKGALASSASDQGALTAAAGGGSFASLRAYGRALAQTPRRLARRACAATAPGEEMSRVRARSGPRMARALRWWDLVGLGLGGMVGAGVFVTTGRATRLYAGPGVVVSYAIAGLCALLSAFCYTEFAVDMPVAGGAFSYLRVTFGEFAAFLTGANLIMEYVFSNAAVARSFTAYLGTAVGVDAPSKWRIPVPGLPEGFNQVDLVAVGVILLITVCICYSTKESSVVNMVLTAVHVAFILFIIVIGFVHGDARNLTRPADPSRNPGGFFPHGAMGVFNGAAMVYLSYIGYDAVSTMAEEVERPARDIPIGVSGSVVVVTVLYCLMAASMSMLLPYDAIDPEAPFSGPFRGRKGMAWVSNVIGAGASLGILTSLMVAMLGQARYLCVIGRSGVMPAWLARVNPRTATPVNASAFLGASSVRFSLLLEALCLLMLVLTVAARRALHGGAGAVHGAGHPAQPRLHRHALRLLHGGQRRRVPPLRRRRRARSHPQSLADAGVPRRLLPPRARLRAGLEAGAARARRADGPPRRVRGARRRHGRRVPGAGAAGARARAVGRARDALGARGVRVPQRLPPGLAGPALLRPLRLLLGRRVARVRALQRARQLRRRGERPRRRRGKGAGRSVHGVAGHVWLTS